MSESWHAKPLPNVAYYRDTHGAKQWALGGRRASRAMIRTLLSVSSYRRTTDTGSFTSGNTASHPTMHHHSSPFVPLYHFLSQMLCRARSWDMGGASDKWSIALSCGVSSSGFFSLVFITSGAFYSWCVHHCISRKLGCTLLSRFILVSLFFF